MYQNTYYWKENTLLLHDKDQQVRLCEETEVVRSENSIKARSLIVFWVQGERILCF